MQFSKRNLKVALTLGLMLLVLLSACRAPAADDPKSPTQDINALYTQVAGTLIAQGQQQAATATTGATNTAIVITATSAFTATPDPALPTATNTTAPATAAPVSVCNQATFITDVTVKDGTQMSKGEDFTKTWRIRNSGTCTWDDDYTVVYEGGTNLASKSSFSLPKEVKPGETVDISIAMEAPDDNGTYRSEWVIRSDSGSEFGVNGSGGSAGVPFFALIRVGAGGGSSGGSGNVRYDFADNLCDADWESGSKNNLPCPGAQQGSDGFVMVLQNPDLETHQEDEPAIWMRPDHAGSGYISGIFPDFTVKDGDHFTAVIGCLDNNSDCRVTFTLSYLRSNGNEVQLGSWDEKFDNQARTLNIDLSNLAGDTINIVLTVDTGNQYFNQANGFWFVPQIVN
jgi:hypothetical protein